MPRAAAPGLLPRKTPVQARSAVTVEAVLDATLQVLVAVGKEKLTTTAVAQRAGVSVGTLYQYFPNKVALLRACLQRHMGQVRQAVEGACHAQRGTPLLHMGAVLAEAFLGAKMQNPPVGAALYAVSSDIDGLALAQATMAHCIRAVARLVGTASDGLVREPEAIASLLMAALQGVARRTLESKHPERELARLRPELARMLESYLASCLVQSRRETLPQSGWKGRSPKTSLGARG